MDGSLRIYVPDQYYVGIQRLEYDTVHQTRLHLRLNWVPVHGSYYSNIELGGITWGLLYVTFMCMQGALPKVSLRWQDLGLNSRAQND